MPSFASHTMTMTRPVSITTPSIRDRNVSRNNDTVSSETASSAGISRRNVAERSSIGRTMAMAPRTSPMLAMFEPMALPKARPGSPRNAAMIETRISGADVANAHDGQADQERRYPEVASRGGGAVHEAVCTPNQE